MMDNGSGSSGLLATLTHHIERVADWLASLPRMQLGVLASSAAALLVIQALSLLLISRDDPAPSLVQIPAFQQGAPSPQSNGEPQGTFAIVAFKPKATAAEIASLLERMGAEAVEGPKANIWRIRLTRETKSKADAEALLRTLKADAAVAFAALAL